MKIKIAERLRPFSHEPSTLVPIPYSDWGVQVFPAMLRFVQIGTDKSCDCKLNIKQPVEQFTALLDLERGAVAVFGKASVSDKTGFYRIWISADVSGEIVIYQEKGEAVAFAELPSFIHACDAMPCHSQPYENLSLGMSKKLDWEMVRRRNDPKEFLPVWFRLGQMMPVSQTAKGASLLNSLAESVRTINKASLEGQFQDLFRSGFRGILFPQSQDHLFQGYALPPVAENPLSLLPDGCQWIRSLFIQEEGNKLHILPVLPHTFHSGRLVGLKTSHALVDMEWRKSRLHTLVLQSQKNADLILQLPKALKRCRLHAGDKTSKRDFSGELAIKLQPGVTLVLDHFEA